MNELMEKLGGLKELLRKLDSMTKYPSIETLHAFGGRQRFIEELTASGKLLFECHSWSLSEKINGTNGRLLLFPKDYLNVILEIVGQHDWLLGTRDNLIMSPTTDPIVMAMIEQLSSEAQRISNRLNSESGKPWSNGVSVLVIYFELFGGNIGAGARNYSRDGSRSFRVFDVRTISLEEVLDILFMPIEKIAGARERNALPGHWYESQELSEFCSNFGLTKVPGLIGPKTKLPEDIQGAYQWLTQAIEQQKIVGEPLGTKAGNDLPLVALDRPEGVVIRNQDRSVIVKLRFEDYERTLGIHRKKK